MTAQLRLLSVELEARRGPDGSHYLRSAHPLAVPPNSVSAVLEARAVAHPERPFLVERSPGGTRTISYQETWTRAQAIGAALLDLGADAARPLMILSENSIDHALLTLGAMQVGVPAAPVSSAYSLASTDHARLLAVYAALGPALVFAASPERYARALEALRVVSGGALGVISGGSNAQGATPISALEAVRPGRAAAEAAQRVGPDTVAKVLFTSGSTGAPAGVVCTQRMLTSNQEMIRAAWPFLADAPPVTLDWLPWSHTFGGNHNFFMMLWSGGTLHIDDGRPAPGLIERTVQSLSAVEPTIYFNVPRGFELLLPHIEQDERARRAFFRRLDLCFYAAAALPPSTWARLERAAEQEGRAVFFTTAWGSTETAPLATSAHFPSKAPGMIGVPAPGVELRLAPVDHKLEIRVRGPNVSPGYWQPGGGVAPLRLDEEGYLRTGDAVLFADSVRPEAGILFDGRIGENFKLASGTWVSTGMVRVRLVSALAPDVSDAVITGHDRAALGALLFAVPPVDDPAKQALLTRIRQKLEAYAEAHPGSSERVGRVLLVFEPPSLDAGETTDKGYVNQRRVLERRAPLVERLYADPPDGEVITV